MKTTFICIPKATYISRKFKVNTILLENQHLTLIAGLSYYSASNHKNGKPEFSYKLKNGITAERLGIWIVENQRIIDIIEEVIKHHSGSDTIQEAGGE